MDKYIETIQKAMDFADLREARQIMDRVGMIQGALHGMLMDLDESVRSVMEDTEVKDKAAAVTRNLAQFKSAVVEAMSEPVEKNVLKVDDEPGEEFVCAFPIMKVDEEHRLVFGIFNMMTKGGELLTDAHDEVIEAEQAEMAAYDFVLNARVGGEAHDRMDVARLVECVALTKEKQAAISEALAMAGVEGATLDLGAEFVWGGFYVHDDEVWKAVKDGRYRAFSIGGVATIEDV